MVLGHAVTFSAPAAWRPLTVVFDGTLGVRVFFVISGFLITTLLLREQERGGIALSRFYIRRALRLGPVQLAYVAALFILTQTTALQVSTCQFVTALTYTKNYACSGWVDGHLWSLSVEEQFYLIWPAVLVFLPARWRVWAVLALMVAAPISRAIQYEMGSRSFTWLTSNADALMAGCLTAMWLGSGRLTTAMLQPRTLLGRVVAVAAIVLPQVLSAHLWLGAFTVTLGPSLQSAAVAYLIVSLVKVEGGPTYVALNLPPVRFLGRMSYSLYVWQELFFTTPAAFGPAAAPWLTFPLNIACALLAGLASYLLIEGPMTRLRARFRSA